MVRSLHRSFACACAIAAAATFMARPAHAATLTYNEISNEATKETTTLDFTQDPALTIAIDSFASPYGSNTVVNNPNGWTITFHPSTLFHAYAANSANAGVTQDTLGKLSFTISFETAQNISAVITEGGHYSTTGNGTVSIFSGGDLFEAVNPLPNELTGTGNLTPVYNTDTHTWSATKSLGGFLGSYTSYHFSIDNDLFAESLASNTPGSACISKDSFSITLTTGGTPTPLPLASFGGLGLGLAALLLRKRIPGILSPA